MKGLLLILMDMDNYCGCRHPDDYRRCRHDVVFLMLTIFHVTAIFSAAPMARKYAAGSREQGDNAY